MADAKVLSNQKTILSNQATIVRNQKAILSNQGAIVKNQKTIIANQGVIKKNQAALERNPEKSKADSGGCNPIALLRHRPCGTKGAPPFFALLRRGWGFSSPCFCGGPCFWGTKVE